MSEPAPHVALQAHGQPCSPMCGRDGRRTDAAADREFWSEFAPRYDYTVGGIASVANALAAVRGLLRSSDTLLDVGAGTGRFAVQLAREVQAITAVDHSPNMLAILSDAAVAAGVNNITVVEHEFTPGSTLPVHDVVLAAWSLYRSTDLDGVLSALVAAARRNLVIVCGVGGHPPHRSMVERHCGAWTESTRPDHLDVALALWRQGTLANISIVDERYRLEASSPIAMAEALAPCGAEPASVVQLADDLQSCLEWKAASVCYECTIQTAVLVAGPIRTTSR